MPLPLGLPGSEDDPFAAAAARTRQGVRPEGGRQEGLGTFLAEHVPRHVLEGLLTLPRRATQAAGDLQRQGDVYDPGPALEAATMTMGATPFGAPRGAMGAGPIKAYHGSPHDFERFDLSKIGTGEGAQAYGHGLYFAENPATAKSYRDTLAPSRGKLPDDIISLPPEMRQAIMAHAGTDADAVTAAKRAQYMSSALREVDLPKVTDMIERARVAKQGRMYEVNINAAPEQFLDWDKALSEMSPEVQKALSGFSPHMTGAQINESARLVPGAYRDNRVATENLRDLGIPGIKYLDQGSRGVLDLDSARRSLARAETRAAEFARSNHPNAPDQLKMYEAEIARHKKQIAEAEANPPTSNYVLFRDDIIDILRKYGLAGLAPAAGAAGMAGQEAPLPLGIPQSQ